MIAAEEGSRPRRTGARKPRKESPRTVATRRAKVRVSLTLAPDQVDELLKAINSESALSAVPQLVAGDATKITELRYRALLDDRRLSRSLLAGLLVLACFTPSSELGIAELSRRLGMRASTTHRYVATLLAAGLLERDPSSRRYRLAAS
ncbi:MAG: helix-turn-helix domain-containing protein [Solirubrobacteraceae bacterium]